MSAGIRGLAPHGLLLLMILVWGGSYVGVKLALRDLSPFELVFARFWIAALCLLPFALLGRGGIASLRSCAGPGLITGTVLAGGYLLQTAGMLETSASTAGLIAGLIPLLVALGGWLFLGARPGRAAVVGFLCGCAGMLVLVWPQDDEQAAGTDRTVGILLQLGASMVYAVHILLLSKFGRTARPLAYSTWQVVVVALLGTLAWLVLSPARSGFEGRCALRLVELLYLGVIATAVGIGVQSVVQPRIAPTHVALLFAAQPLFAALAGAALLADRLGVLQAIGGAVIVLGIVVAAFDRPRGPKSSAIHCAAQNR